MDSRRYNRETDRDDVFRIYSEIGWMRDDEDSRESNRILFEEVGRTHVALLNGQAECVVVHGDSHLTHLEERLPMNVVAAVATGRVARKQRLASRLTAKSLAAEVVEEGAIVSALGMFEQGFYDRLGYGTGSYLHRASVDPANLRVDREPRPPIRLTKDDWERAHRNRVSAHRCHGACTPVDPRVTRSEMQKATNGFGLGYEDLDTGELTHHLWCGAHNRVNGPYYVSWFAFRTREQFLELMALIAGLGDQVNLVHILEPAGIQLQDLEKKPFQRGRVGRNGDMETRIWSFAWWQMRMLDVVECVRRARFPAGEEVRFNLSLTDPIEGLLDGSAWRGVAGDYTVTFGPECACEQGHSPGLPLMRASVNTFTRLWLGVRPPTGLAFTCPDLEAPGELLARLDRTLRMPAPQLDWNI